LILVDALAAHDDAMTFGGRAEAGLPQRDKGELKLASPTQTVKALQYLRDAGMSISLLNDLHHSEGGKITFVSAIRYFSKTTALRDANTKFSDRLTFVEREHRATGEGFDAIVARARQKFP